jgi:carbon-monoxide dehydrogenase medium subunit
MLSEAARVIGGHQVRNVATIGGNIVNASPAADLVAPLLALDATLTLRDAENVRGEPLEAFLKGAGLTSRRPGELLTEIAFAAPAFGSASVFLKAGRRKAMEISVVCVAACLTLTNGICSDARIALGAVGPRTLRARAAEAFVEGREAKSEVFQEAGRLAALAGSPRSDVRASAEYRRSLTETLVERALAECAYRARNTAS